MRVFLLLTSIATCLAGAIQAAQPGVPPQVAEINTAIEQQWRDYEIKPAPEAPDAIWCRRVYLDVIGRIPTLQELNEFLQDRSPGNRQRLVEKLLEDDRYAEEYAGHWATVWSNILIGRSGGQDNN